MKRRVWEEAPPSNIAGLAAPAGMYEERRTARRSLFRRFLVSTKDGDSSILAQGIPNWEHRDVFFSRQEFALKFGFAVLGCQSDFIHLFPAHLRLSNWRCEGVNDVTIRQSIAESNFK